MKKENYLSRSQLLSQLVTEADDFTALRYLKHRDDTPRLIDLEKSGVEVLPNAQGALADMYYSLWSPEPGLKPADKTSASLSYWRSMLDSAYNTTAFQQMHAQTQLQELTSLIGTLSMGEETFKLIPKEDQEKLKGLQEAEKEASDAQQQMQLAQADVGAANQLISQLQAVMQGNSSAQAQEALANVKSQMQQAQSNAQAAEMTLQEATAKADQIAQDLMGKPGTPEAQAKQTQLQRAAQAAATRASEEVKEVSNLLQSWGIEPKELGKGDPAEALKVIKCMRKSEAFKKFKDILGRMRQIAARKSKSNITKEGRFVPKVEYGRDIAKAGNDQIAALVNPTTRMQTLQSWMRSELQLKGQKFKANLGKGPVVVCEDASGSMDGDKQQWAKAVVLALAYFAKLENRTFVWILYDSVVHKAKVFISGRLTPQDMLEVAEARAGGGTNFERPLSKAIELIQKQSLKKADICFITDGECAVSTSWLKNFLNEKQKMEVNVITVLVDVGDTSCASVKEFSTSIQTVSSFTAEEAGQKIIANLT